MFEELVWLWIKIYYFALCLFPCNCHVCIFLICIYYNIYNQTKIEDGVIVCPNIVGQGGLPAWLLKKKNIVLRSSDPGDNRSPTEYCSFLIFLYDTNF